MKAGKAAEAVLRRSVLKAVRQQKQLLIAWIYYQRAHTDHIRKSKEEAFWEKENRANTMRKKDISSLNYICVCHDCSVVCLPRLN